MVEFVATQSAWLVPHLIQLVHSPEAALLPGLPILSYMSACGPIAEEVPTGSPRWSWPWNLENRGACPGVVTAVAITEQEHRASDALVGDRYAWRGYSTAARDPESCEQPAVTLLSWSGADAVGTMTMGFDNGCGLLVDQTYAESLDAIRADGRTVCEFTRFAVSSTADSKATISGLFDLSYVLGRKMMGVTDVVVEVNPRHVGFYRRAFGFRPISDVRTCGRVKAPAVLLRLDVAEMETRMRAAGARTPGELALARA